MGVTITYSGKIKSVDLIPELIDEFKDICEVMSWSNHIYDDSFDEPVSLTTRQTDKGLHIDGNAGLRGISFNPHEECEPVHLVFQKDGQLSNLTLALFPNEGNLLFTKTQFAGIDIHIRIVELLEYVSAKYLTEFEIRDDCEYIEFRDRARSLKNQIQSRRTLVAVLSDLESSYNT